MAPMWLNYGPFIYLIKVIIMINLVAGQAYRVYTQSNNAQVGTDLIISDEKLVIFNNDLVYVMNRNKSLRRFYESINEYKTAHSEVSGEVIGLCDLHYDEPFALSTLIVSLTDSPDSYTGKQMLEIIIKLKALFYNV